MTHSRAVQEVMYVEMLALINPRLMRVPDRRRATRPVGKPPNHRELQPFPVRGTLGEQAPGVFW